MLIKTHWTILAAACLLVGMAQADVSENPSRQPENIQTTELGAYQSRVFFYRLNDFADNSPINIYVNERYQGSLLNNTFSTAIVCADKQLFAASISKTDDFDNKKNGIILNLPVNESAYLKLIRHEQSGRPMFMAVPADVAQRELATTHMANQTLSRLPAPNLLNCQAPAILQTNTLSATALFGFNQFAFDKIEASGYQELLQIIKQIKQLNNNKIDKIVINGYADPSGSDEYNQLLSQKRADVIQAALRREGVNAPILARGLGNSELRVANCERLYPNNALEKQACNQPNRRVEITVYGKM